MAKLTQEYLATLPDWVVDVLTTTLCLSVEDDVFDAEIDYMLPWDETPNVGLDGSGKNVTYIVVAKGNGLLDIYTRDGHYQNCSIKGINMGGQVSDSVVEDVYIDYNYRTINESGD